MTTELPGEPAELLSSVFGEQHWQWNCKWSWKCRNNRRLIGSKSCTFRLSGLLCLLFFTGDNKYSHPPTHKNPRNGVLLGRLLWNPGVCLHTTFASDSGRKLNTNRQLTPSVFCAALSAGLIYIHISEVVTFCLFWGKSGA